MSICYKNDAINFLMKYHLGNSIKFIGEGKT